MQEVGWGCPAVELLLSLCGAVAVVTTRPLMHGGWAILAVLGYTDNGAPVGFWYVAIRRLHGPNGSAVLGYPHQAGWGALDF